MRYSTTIVVAALSIGQTMAGPTHAHLHRHRNVHEKKAAVDWDALDWNAMGIDWSSAWAAGQHQSTTAPAPVETPTPSPAVLAEVATTPPAAPATPTPSAKSSVSSSNDAVSDVTSGATTAFSNIKGLSNGRTSFGGATESSGSVIDKVGNIGSPVGSNIIAVPSTEGYDFTNTFTNTQSKAITIVVWNKATANADKQVLANLGSCLALTQPALSFTLAPGASQVVAFAPDSQGGWSEATTDVAASGAPAITWGEFNFNPGNSGYDVSAIMNVHGNTYDMEISADESDCKSTMNENMWIAQNGNSNDPVPVGNSDGSCYLPASTATLRTKMGGTV